jgi:hypothetical protein
MTVSANYQIIPSHSNNKVRQRKMKIWKIVTIVALATILGALLGSTAYGYMDGYSPHLNNGTIVGRSGMMTGDYGNGYYNNAQVPNQKDTIPNQQVYPYQSGWGCGGIDNVRFGK